MSWSARGSQLQTQLYVNLAPSELSAAVIGELPELEGRELRWVAPLEQAAFAEPRDRAFLNAIGCEHLETALASFWPVRGPVWDALGVTGDRAVVLVEAKSHPQEIYGGGTKAGPVSRKQIKKALAETQRWLGVDERPERWMDPLRPEEPGHSSVYQSANRYAHLYWLRQQGIDASLVHLLFVDDPTFGRTSREVWEAALPQVEDDLGVRGVRVPHARHIFLPGLDPLKTVGDAPASGGSSRGTA
jgi:hypothetical protein